MVDAFNILRVNVDSSFLTYIVVSELLCFRLAFQVCLLTFLYLNGPLNINHDLGFA